MHICVYLCSCTLHSAQFPSSELLWLLSSADIDSCGRGHILPLPHYIWHLSNLYGKCHNLPSVRSFGYCLPFVCYLHANQLLPSSSSICLVSSTAVTSVSSVAAISTYCPYWSMSFPLLLSRSFLFYLNVFSVVVLPLKAIYFQSTQSPGCSHSRPIGPLSLIVCVCLFNY